MDPLKKQQQCLFQEQNYWNEFFACRLLNKKDVNVEISLVTILNCPLYQFKWPKNDFRCMFQQILQRSKLKRVVDFRYYMANF